MYAGAGAGERVDDDDGGISRGGNFHTAGVKARASMPVAVQAAFPGTLTHRSGLVSDLASLLVASRGNGVNFNIIIIIKRRSGINPIPPTVIDRD